MLLGPAPVRLAAARGASDAQEAWMLRQPRDVRASFVREVFGTKVPYERAQEIWMLRQPKAVRESYIRDLLDG